MTLDALIVEDDEILADNLQSYLAGICWNAEICASAEAALERITKVRPAVILADVGLPGIDGLELLERTRKTHPAIKFIMMTGNGDVQTAVRAMKAGAFDYLSKPAAFSQVRAVLDRVLVASGSGNAQPQVVRRHDAEGASADDMIGDCPEMMRMRQTVDDLLRVERGMALRDLPVVLIQGETGTGKQLVARALHYGGSRKSGPFVEINCASIPSHLLEAELFGHEKGAFTDARDRKIGLVEAAQGGTLFLDEIGEVDLPLQAKLLKLLEDKSIRRLGSVSEIPVDLRIISATNRDLEQMVRERAFRSDLFFRLRIVSIKVPPLRARGNDILALAHFYLKCLSERYGKTGLAFSAEAEQAMLAYSWPGNVRELRNTIEEAVLLTRESWIGPERLHQCHQLLGEQHRRATDRPPGAISLPQRNAQLTPEETQQVVSVLEQFGWNITKAAQHLGLTRDMLRYRIEKLGLSRPD